MTLFYSILSICIGASFGATSRWLLSLAFNALFPPMPLGTLFANLLGAFLIGIGLTFFSYHSFLNPAWKLLIITGFLGSLTTFSTFSAEVNLLLKDGKLLWGMALISTHVIGSLIMTFLGILLMTYIKNS